MSRNISNIEAVEMRFLGDINMICSDTVRNEVARHNLGAFTIECNIHDYTEKW
jgi:hypothetical protein